MKNLKSSTIIKKMFLLLLFMLFVIFGTARANILVTKAYNSKEIHVNYSLHMQNIGWQEFKNDDIYVSTVFEDLKISLKEIY